MPDDSIGTLDCVLFLNTKAHWTRHNATTKPVASLNPRSPGLAERRSSENAGMDTSTKEIMKIARPSPFSDVWLCL